MRLIATLLAVVAVTPVFAADKLVVYTARNEQLIKPLFDAYTQETGTTVEFLTDKEAPLLARLEAEGKSTPADVLVTVDAGNLWLAAEKGLLAPLDSKSLTGNIPAHLRDPQNRWFGLSVRARTVIYNPAQMKPEQLTTYAALAEPEFKGKLCLRSSKKVYNQSLTAVMLAELGAEKTEAIVRGWVANLAADPFASDDEVIQAVAAGRCAVGIVNTYYFGRLKRAQPELSVELYWPNQAAGESGVHINVSGAGVTTHAKNPKTAQHFLEWLSAGKAQAMFASLNLEFPANAAVAADPEVAAWGAFRQDVINVNEAGRLQVEAVKLMDRAGWK